MAKTTHTHHIVPRHMGGDDSPDNLVELSVEDHAQAHRILYETHGLKADLMAWLMLSGKTTEGELVRIELAKEGHKKFRESGVAYKNAQKKTADALRGRKLSVQHAESIGKGLKLYYTDNPEAIERQRQIFLTHIEQHRVRMQDAQHIEKMATARRNSVKWQTAVRSEECRAKKSDADPRRRPVIVEGVEYAGLRVAARQTGYTYNKLRWHLIRGNTDFIRFK